MRTEELSPSLKSFIRKTVSETFKPIQTGSDRRSGEYIDKAIEIAEKNLQGSGLVTARNLKPGQIYHIEDNRTCVKIQGGYNFRIISSNASELRPGMGTPNIRCEVVEKTFEGNWSRKDDTREFSVYDFELVKANK